FAHECNEAKMNFDRVVLVTKSTPLNGLIRSYGTLGQAKFILEQTGNSIDNFVRYDDVYNRALDNTRDVISQHSKLAEVDSRFLSTYQFAPGSLVVTLGPDGLVANVAKYLHNQPIFAINADPLTYDGVLARNCWNNLFLAFLNPGQLKQKKLSMAEARTHDGQRLLAVNDLFVGIEGHVSARYVIEYEGRREFQSSSGIIVSTGAGSTGWRRSVFEGAAGLLESVGQHDLANELRGQYSFPAENRWISFSVREPFVSVSSKASIVHGGVAEGERLIIRSEMPTGGIVFSDGVPEDYLRFTSGTVVEIGVAERFVTLLEAV
ncbi:MAG TPA: hypothetical protein VK171_08425, partial [Fimbriimonas sp.]|nr:hypothetical protein [Fimbriimonas sp.]